MFTYLHWQKLKYMETCQMYPAHVFSHLDFLSRKQSFWRNVLHQICVLFGAILGIHIPDGYG